MPFYAERYTNFSIICDSCWEGFTFNSTDTGMPRTTNDTLKYARGMNWRIGKDMATCPRCRGLTTQSFEEFWYGKM